MRMLRSEGMSYTTGPAIFALITHHRVCANVANRGDSPQIAMIHHDNTLRVIRDYFAVISLRPSRDKDQLLNHRKTLRIAVIGVDFYI
ncbi:hypothetical protein DPMN_166828 [Dreissena polymorpha]|uniref:Uncharacterized protein n=1 Tax=Dreissena polymorpha TaxID=45954 RepID=A0A9D4IXV9_DREPO|nr:hypothetical protein DPMN_166732 [Dreissena polymorpha]KAH3788681.1 hypothetical protein DPMN_166828 [Dreissena polymorpha]